MLKYGIYHGSIDDREKITKEKSLNIYGKWIANKGRIENEIIPNTN
jgi:hypothetical protein